MRIAIVNPISQTSPDRWSTPRVVSNRQSITVQMARHLESLGAEVTMIMAAPFRPEVSDEGVECHYLEIARVPWAPAAQIPWMKGLGPEIERGRFDALVSSEVFQWATLRLTYGRTPPLFVWHEADCFQRFGRTIPARTYYMTAGKRIARRAAGFIPRTDSARQFLSSVGVSDAKLGPEVPNGIDSSRFAPQPDSRDEAPLILYVGSLIERKNPGLAVRSMQHVLQSHPDARLWMKGFGEEEAALRRLAAELGISEHVVLDTERSNHAEMAALYNRAWAAVFPSFRDFASLSPIEAVACGVPVVLSTRLFHASYLEAAGCGRASSDDDIEFGAAIVGLLDAFGRVGLSQAQITPVVDRFSLASGAGRMLEYLESALGTSRTVQAL